MRLLSLIVVALLAVAPLTGMATAAENTPPLADAGLDQTVTTNTTVYLDANGSRDPDGTVARAVWTIETPSGATVSPDCRTCRQTRFQPDTVGQYNVTLTVTDDDGATRSDTLHVVVSPSKDPAVSLTGPSTVARGIDAQFTAVANGSGTTLSTLTWVVDGDVTNRTSVASENATTTTVHSFDTAGTRSVRVVAYDALGRRGTTTTSVVVVNGSRSGGLPDSNNGNGRGGGGGDCHFWENDCLNDVVLKSPDGEKRIVDANRQDGIQLWIGGDRVTASDHVDVSNFKMNDGAGGYALEEMKQAVREDKNGNEKKSTDSDPDNSDGGGNDNSESSGGSSGGSNDFSGLFAGGSGSGSSHESVDDSGGSSNDDSGGSSNDDSGGSNDFSGLFAGGTGSGSSHEPIDDSGSSSSSGGSSNDDSGGTNKFSGLFAGAY